MNTQTQRIAISGAILFLSSVAAIITIHIAEALTPAYSTSAETVSGIGSTFFSSFACFAAHCNVIYQPASAMLIFLLGVFGVLFIFMATVIEQASRNHLVSRTFALIGLNSVLLGTSYLPLYGTPSTAWFNFAFILHSVTSGLLLAVLPAYLMLRAHTFTRAPFGHVSWILGAVVIIAIPIYIYMYFNGILAGPGFGGVERIIIYTGLAWFAGFGAYLTAAPDVLILGNVTNSR